MLSYRAHMQSQLLSQVVNQASQIHELFMNLVHSQEIREARASKIMFACECQQTHDHYWVNVL